jgi:hypothetical protein
MRSPGDLGMTRTRWALGLVTLVTSACTGDIGDAGRGAPRAVDTNGDGIPDAVLPGGIGPTGGPGVVPAGTAGAGASPLGASTPSAATLRRLTPAQYRNSVLDLTGVEPDVAGLTSIPPLSGLQAIGASSVTLAELDLEAFESLADGLSAQLFADPTLRTKLVGCDAQQSACAEAFVASFGRRAFRRPLSDDERTRYVELLRSATQMTGDGWLGLRVVSSAFLQSPSFLYRAELGAPDPAAPTRRLLDAYELASRLSFFLWNTTPDDALLDAAAAGTLATAAGVATEAQRLLASPRAAAAIDQLFTDYLRLDALDELVKLPDVYPAATPTLPAAMREQTLRSLRTLLFERDGDFRTAFTTETTFVDAELAELYDLPEPAGTGFREVTLPASGARAGLLTQASFLATHAHPGRTSPTRRGKFIRESLLCQAVPAPPPDVDTTLPDTSDARTLREKLTEHRDNPACSGCHTLMDPLGLALEHFDGIGAHRTVENGVAIDASGDLDGLPFSDARGLGAALAADPRLADCFARTLLRYARGALETPSEEALLAELTASFAAAGYRVRELIQGVVTADAFRHVGGLP